MLNVIYVIPLHVEAWRICLKIYSYNITPKHNHKHVFFAAYNVKH